VKKEEVDGVKKEDGDSPKRKQPDDDAIQVNLPVKTEPQEEVCDDNQPPIKRERLAEDAPKVANPLTSGAVKKLVENKGIDPPRLQVLEIERRDNHKRHKIQLSDGDNIVFGMTNTELHPLFESGAIVPGVVLTLQVWVRNVVGDKTMMSVLQVGDVTEPMERIGNPELVEAPANDPAARLVGSAKKAPSGVAQRPPDEVTAGRGPGAPPVRNTVQDLHETRPMGRLVGRVVERRGPFAFKGKRQGSLMKCIFEDDTGRISATTFSKEMIAKMQEVELHTVVSFTDPKGTVQKANPQYQVEGCVTNELKISGEGSFSPVTDEDELGAVQGAFKSKDATETVPLRNLSTMDAKASVPLVVGLVVRVQPNVTNVPKRDGSGSFEKRQIDLVDETGATRVDLFGKLATLPVWDGIKKQGVVAIELHNGTVNEYNGTFSLTAWDGSATVRVLELEEDERAMALATWLVRGVDVANAEDGVATATGSAAFLADVAAHDQRELFYPSCPRDPTHQRRLEACGGQDAESGKGKEEAKVKKEESGGGDDKKYKCPKCPDDAPIINLKTDPVIWRWSFNATLRDETGETVATVFDEQGKILMGISATQFRALSSSEERRLHVASRKFRMFDAIVLVEPTPTQNGTGAVRMRRTLLSATLVGGPSGEAMDLSE
jgi:hypothetical protein